MTQNSPVDFEIDAVVAWVDGNDEFHQQKMRNYLKNDTLLNNKNFLTRYQSVDEIEFSIRSIIKYAPFIRNIFIVTDLQIPNCFKQLKEEEQFGKPRIVLVDHKEIFKGFESFTPTFNSVSIETMIYRIPNLTEHFIYFNDDVFLLREIKTNDFFSNGFPVLRGKYKPFDGDIWYKVIHQKIMRWLGKTTKDKKYGYKKAQQNIAVKLGFQKYLRLDHTPAAMRKSTIKNYFEEYPEMIIHNIKHRFRYPTQYMIQSLANHLEIQNKTCVIKDDYQLGYIQSYKKPLLWYKLKLKYFENDTNTLFLCLQSLDQCPKLKLNFILNWLKKLI